ncbi:hypothetical protein [uncultured Mucilaginibacter sp.]|uniref:hypothetical protein n=1 Tax=uncultured Mucilaginibacter sp. TaxID=797541 RepID=UPI00260DD2C2|nr:hypothetical protein [uncultured Mucilaginibacter sp.]
MNQQDNSAFNGQTDRSKQTSSNQNQVVWEGGSYSDKPTTEADVQKNDDLEFGDHGTTTMNPTNDATESSIDDDDEDFDDNVGEDNLPDKDGFNANSDDPTERELTKTWIGNEKSVHEAGAKGLEGEPMGGQNFGTSELELKNERDQSDSETHSQGWGNSALQTPSEEISNPPEIEDGGEHPDRKKMYD